MLLPENRDAVRACRHQVGRGETVIEDGTHPDVGQPVNLCRNVVGGEIAFFYADDVVVTPEVRSEGRPLSRLLVDAIAECVDPALRDLAEVVGLWRLVLVVFDQTQRRER